MYLKKYIFFDIRWIRFFFVINESFMNKIIVEVHVVLFMFMGLNNNII